MLDVREMKNYKIGKELTLEEAMNLPSGTLVWVTNIHIPDGQVRQIKTKGYYGLHGSDIIQSNGNTGINGGFGSEQLKIYEWKEDVKMNNYEAITVEEILNNVEAGDLIYLDYSECGTDHTGWRLMVTKDISIGLNTQNKRSKTSDLKISLEGRKDRKLEIRYIDVSKIPSSSIGTLANFMKDFNEEPLEEYIKEVKYKSKKEEKLETLINDLSTQLDNAKKQLEEVRGM